MKNVSNFQLIVAGIFGALAVGGLIAFATFSGSGKDATVISVWTDVDNVLLQEWLELAGEDKYHVDYRYIPSDQLVQTVIEDLSLGISPDVLITDVNRQFELGQRLQLAPTSSLSRSDFRSRYVTGAEYGFIRPGGYAGLPLFVDPIVMYSNRRLLDNNAVANPPSYWDELSALTTKYAKTNGRQIEQIVIPFGTYQNVNQAKNILATMLAQIDVSPLVLDTNGSYRPDLVSDNTSSVVRYYTDFANPGSAVYNWNDLLKSSFDTFIAEESFFYLGKASEYQEILDQNPNLDLLVSEVPQIRGEDKVVSANFYGALFPRKSDLPVVFDYLNELYSHRLLGVVATQTGLSPATRDELNPGSDNQLESVSARSVLYSRTWPDLDKESSDQVLGDMINDILYRNIPVSQAITAAESNLYEVI